MEILKKLHQQGLCALSEGELLGLLLGGHPEFGQGLACRNSLKELARMGYSDLMACKGMTPSRAGRILVAFELGRRKNRYTQQRIKITSSEVAADYMGPNLEDKNQEEFWVLYLNRNNEVMARVRHFVGGVSSTIIDPRLIFKEAINRLASGLILLHNHPSGNLTPSRADLEATQKLVEGGKLFDIHVLDHIILSDRDYYSMLDNDLM